MTDAARAEADPAQRVVRQIAGWLLPGAPAIESLDDPALAAPVVAAATSHRLLGPLLAAVAAGDAALPDEQYQEAAREHEASMVWCLMVERRLLEVSLWFAEVGGVEHLVVKGPVVAHLDEADPSLRSFADLDLLVHGRDMDRAVRVLEQHGAERRMPERRPGFDRRFVKSVALASADGIELDIHRTLCDGAYGFRVPLERVFGSAQTFDLAGHRVAVPERRHRALHASYHAMLGTPTPPLRTLRDLAGYLTSPDLPPSVLAEEARRWRGEAVLHDAVRSTLDTLSIDIPVWRRWLDETHIPESEVDLVHRSRSETAIPMAWSTVRELTWPDRVRFSWAVAMPSRADLEARGMTRTGRITGGMRGVARELRQRWSSS